MAKEKPEPIGADYWRQLTTEQESLGAALTPDYRPLRAVFTQSGMDSETRASAHVRWEKLLVWGLLDVDRKRNDSVYVRRGPLWANWWRDEGGRITRRQLSDQVAVAEFGEVLKNFNPPN